ncbi:MAG: hypothetical protein AB8E15_09260 [Bdellovibrionales bacterium]
MNSFSNEKLEDDFMAFQDSVDTKLRPMLRSFIQSSKTNSQGLLYAHKENLEDFSEIQIETDSETAIVSFDDSSLWFNLRLPFFDGSSDIQEYGLDSKPKNWLERFFGDPETDFQKTMSPIYRTKKFFYDKYDKPISPSDLERVVVINHFSGSVKSYCLLSPIRIPSCYSFGAIPLIDAKGETFWLQFVLNHDIDGEDFVGFNIKADKESFVFEKRHSINGNVQAWENKKAKLKYESVPYSQQGFEFLFSVLAGQRTSFQAQFVNYYSRLSKIESRRVVKNFHIDFSKFSVWPDKFKVEIQQ